MWDLVPCPGIEPRPPALGAWSPIHCTTREVPQHSCFLNFIFVISIEYKVDFLYTDLVSYNLAKHVSSSSLFCFCFCCVCVRLCFPYDFLQRIMSSAKESSFISSNLDAFCLFAFSHWLHPPVQCRVEVVGDCVLTLFLILKAKYCLTIKCDISCRFRCPLS